MPPKKRDGRVFVRKIKQERTDKRNARVLTDHVRIFTGDDTDTKRITGKGKQGDPKDNGHKPK